MQLACKIGATCSEYVTFSSAAYAGCVITSMPTTTAASAEIRGWSFISDVSLIGKRSPTPSLGGTLEPRTDGSAASMRLSTTCSQPILLPDYREGAAPREGGAERPLMTSPRASSTTMS